MRPEGPQTQRAQPHHPKTTGSTSKKNKQKKTMGKKNHLGKKNRHSTTPIDQGRDRKDPKRSGPNPTDQGHRNQKKTVSALPQLTREETGRTPNAAGPTPPTQSHCNDHQKKPQDAPKPHCCCFFARNSANSSNRALFKLGFGAATGAGAGEGDGREGTGEERGGATEIAGGEETWGDEWAKGSWDGWGKVDQFPAAGAQEPRRPPRAPRFPPLPTTGEVEAPRAAPPPPLPTGRPDGAAIVDDAAGRNEP